MTHPLDKVGEAISPVQAQRLDAVRAAAKMLHAAYTDLLPPGREKALAFTKLEEAAMWASKAITHNDIP